MYHSGDNKEFTDAFQGRCHLTPSSTFVSLNYGISVTDQTPIQSPQLSCPLHFWAIGRECLHWTREYQPFHTNVSVIPSKGRLIEFTSSIFLCIGWLFGDGTNTSLAALSLLSLGIGLWSSRVSLLSCLPDRPMIDDACKVLNWKLPGFLDRVASPLRPTIEFLLSFSSMRCASTFSCFHWPLTNLSIVSLGMMLWARAS